MKRNIQKTCLLLLTLLCIGFHWGCGGKIQNQPPTGGEEELPKEKQENSEMADNFSEDKQEDKNRELFYEKADSHGISRTVAETYFQTLLKDNVFQDGTMELTELIIDDMDGNGRNDMLAMVADAGEQSFYGSGCIWFYMNEDDPYCFDDEDCSYRGLLFYAFWEDIDNDGNIEIVFSAQGCGVGAVGDSYKAILKYKDHKMERMELPSDFEEDYDCGLTVTIRQEPEKDRYSAYCPYLDDTIHFRTSNIEDWEPPATAREVGGNARGFFNLRCVEYEGKNALQVSEYLYGEGGIAHGIATAEFLIVWDGDGQANVAEWWLLTDGNNWADSHGSRIAYAEGYCYYASQLDHYYLYRANQDGSNPQCLAKVHAGNICVQDGSIYFINYSDGQGIYRVGTDGSGLEKLCGYGQDLQIGGGYVYFRSVYEAEYDRYGLVTGETSEFDENFLYRMKKDGSEKILLIEDVSEYALGGQCCQDSRYADSIFCVEYRYGEAVINRFDIDGQKEEELCIFDFYGTMMVYGDSVYMVKPYIYDNNEGKISRYSMENGKTTTFSIPRCIDFCIYKGYLYGLDEQAGEEKRKFSIYRLDLSSVDSQSGTNSEYCAKSENGTNSEYSVNSENDANSKYGVNNENGVNSKNGTNSENHTNRKNSKACACETIYEYDFECKSLNEARISDFYATEDGIFLRRFVSSKEGCEWFKLTEDGTAEKWEDTRDTPSVLPATMVEYGELRSVTSVLRSTEGAEEYIAGQLEYQEFHEVDENGEGHNPYTICLPQFNSKIAGYQEINKYFQKEYEKAMDEKETFFQMLEEDGWAFGGWQDMDYGYLYIGEHYITVAQYASGYWGGIRCWNSEKPVTFERDSGKVVTLEELTGMPLQEFLAMATASIYKYMECIGKGNFFFTDYDKLTEEYDPGQFFLFPEGIGLYYRRYAIDCGAAGDYLFLIPWDEIRNRTPSPSLPSMP